MFSAYSFPGFTGTSAIRHNIPLNNIEKAVCEAFCIDPNQLRKKTTKGKLSRKREIVKARHTFYWLAKKYTLLSLTSIGLYFMQDHTSVLHSIRQVNNLFDSKDKAFLPLIKHAESKLLPLIIIENEKEKQNPAFIIPARTKPFRAPVFQPRYRNPNPRRSQPPLPAARRGACIAPYFRTSLRINATT